MACDKRQRTGHCGHHQCEFKYETDHGYECVEIVGGFCEAGDNCLKQCPYSYKVGTKREKQALKAFQALETL